MSRSSGDSFVGASGSEDRAAVEPLVALVAVLVVGAALSLYVGALDGATDERHGPSVEVTLDRIEQQLARGGVVEPSRLRVIEMNRYPTTVTVTTDGGAWRAESGPDAPAASVDNARESVGVAERPVTVRVAPGRNVRGTLRVVVRR